jgi:hypothetical protein
MRGPAQEHSTPGAPLLHRAEVNQLLSALLAGEDDLLDRTLHKYTPSSALLGITFVSLVGGSTA